MKIFDFFYTIIYSFGIFENLLNLYTYRWPVFILLGILIFFIVYKQKNKKGFYPLIVLLFIWIFICFIIPVRRNSELENSRKIGFELVEKLNEYKVKHGTYPVSISQSYSELKNNKGIVMDDIHYFRSDDDVFEIIIQNDNWAWFSLRYRNKKNVFELSDSD